MDDNQLARIRNREIGFVFQTFNLLPRASALSNVELPLIYAGMSRKEREESAKAALRAVDLEQRMSHKPSELSGGQRQRVAIARALAVEPSVILADEPISMLDVSIRIGILNLILQLKRELGIAFLYITHDIASARYVADEVLVMYRGRIVEQGPTDAVLLDPQHAYTRLLLSAVPSPESGLRLEPLVRAELRDESNSQLVEVRSGHYVRRPL
jgi:peptide/nickel transport system ATP-binding protein